MSVRATLGRRPAVRIGTAALLTAAALLAPQASAHAASSEVSIEDFSYKSGVVTVKVGDTVTWTNKDTVRHDVQTSKAPKRFASPLLSKGETFSYKFASKGTYEYFCGPHSYMVAKVIVK